jgi:hypothetical protein
VIGASRGRGGRFNVGCRSASEARSSRRVSASRTAASVREGLERTRPARRLEVELVVGSAQALRTSATSRWRGTRLRRLSFSRSLAVRACLCQRPCQRALRLSFGSPVGRVSPRVDRTASDEQPTTKTAPFAPRNSTSGRTRTSPAARRYAGTAGRGQTQDLSQRDLRTGVRTAIGLHALADGHRRCPVRQQASGGPAAGRVRCRRACRSHRYRRRRGRSRTCGARPSLRRPERSACRT